MPINCPIACAINDGPDVTIRKAPARPARQVRLRCAIFASIHTSFLVWVVSWVNLSILHEAITPHLRMAPTVTSGPGAAKNQNSAASLRFTRAFANMNKM